jgi:hypothetical protein
MEGRSIMKRSTIIATALATLVAVTGSTAATGTAERQWTELKSSRVKITTSGFDFGGRTYLAGAPTGSGDLAWRYSDGEVRPRLTGYLHLNEVRGACARMRIDYYGGAHVRLATERGGTVCASHDRHHVWSVTLEPYDSRKIDEVKVSIETENDAGGWSIAASRTFGLNPIRSDAVRIALPRSAGVDFGGAGFAAGSPIGSGEVAWRLLDGQLTPHLTGVLHVSNAAGACARVRLQYWDRADVELADKHGGTVCAADNGHHAWSVDLEPYGDPSLDRVSIMLQRQVDCCTWRTYYNPPVIHSGTLHSSASSSVSG